MREMGLRSRFLSLASGLMLVSVAHVLSLSKPLRMDYGLRVFYTNDSEQGKRPEELMAM